MYRLVTITIREVMCSLIRGPIGDMGDKNYIPEIWRYKTLSRFSFLVVKKPEINKISVTQ
jgi:hypothetical protein